MTTKNAKNTTKKAQRRQEAEAQKKQLQADLKALEPKITEDAETAERFAAVAERFASYSIKNQMLIFMQNPDATLCAGFRQWQKEGRQVRKGEKAGFIMVSVFDVSQTEEIEADDSKK